MTLVQTEPKKIYMWVEVQPITVAWIYHNSDLWLISLSSDGINWITIADKNLWATTVYNSGDTLSESNCGKFYQRWNNYWFSWSWTISSTTTKVNASNYWPWNYYSWSSFIKVSYWWDWSTSQNDNLRWNTTDTLAARQWPCESWFHVPTYTEYNTLYNTYTALWLSWVTNFIKCIKIPLAWYRDISNATAYNSWVAWYYFTSVPYNSTQSRALAFDTSIIPWSYMDRWHWCSLRPFKNESVQPREWWTKLN